MRLSVDPNDRGFAPAAIGARVFLDGVEVQDVVTADEELGEVIVLERNEAGEFFLDLELDEAKRATRNGVVRIETTAA